jgi:hypothetical protein
MGSNVPNFRNGAGSANGLSPFTGAGTSTVNPSPTSPFGGINVSPSNFQQGNRNMPGGNPSPSQSFNGGGNPQTGGGFFGGGGFVNPNDQKATAPTQGNGVINNPYMPLGPNAGAYSPNTGNGAAAGLMSALSGRM